VLLETMYDLPSLKGVQKVVVDESVIEGHNKPYVVLKTEAPASTEEPARRSVG